MIFFILLLLLIILYKSKFNFKSFNTDYISIEQTKCINAIFVVLVFLSHVKTYIYLDDVWFNSYFLKINILLDQLIVTTFLFFSGFGIMESIKKKKEKYINSMPKKRLLNTFINFDIAVLLFFICDLITNQIHNYSIKDILLSFTGWSSIGNSNWYIFDILVLYLFTWISFKIFNKSNIKAIWSTTILSLFFIYFLKISKDVYWYNTILCYVAGMFYSYFKPKIEKFICENNKTYLFTLFVCCIGFVILYKFLKGYSFMLYELTSIIFVIIILLICMKFSFKNKILTYLGNNIFWIYILQRIPMMLLKHYNLNNYNSYLFIIICFILTLLLTELVKLLIKLFNKTTSLIGNKYLHSKSEL